MSDTEKSMSITDSIALVVEDSDEDFDTVMEAATKSGLHLSVRRAATGGECIDLLKESPAPSVILLDLNTPGADGREALAHIKSSEALKKVPVVVLTTSANPRDLTFCYDKGANAYHMKPVRYPEHLDLLTDVFQYWVGRVMISHKPPLRNAIRDVEDRHC